MDQTTKQIIHNLANRQPREGIVQVLSERFRLSQEDAERLISEIENKHYLDIHKRRRPLLLLSRGILAVGGFALTIYLALITIRGSNLYLFQIPIPFLGEILLWAIGLLASWWATREFLRLVRGST